MVFIPMSNCSGVEDLHVLQCGLCDGLAVNPLSHNGGYNQEFCRRLFCGECRLIRVNSPTHRKIGAPINPFKKKKINNNNEEASKIFIECPIDGCSVNFYPPYFTEPGLGDSLKYSRLLVTCEKCKNVLAYPVFLDHWIQCKGGVPSVNPSSTLHDSSSILSNSRTVGTFQSVCKEASLTAISYNGYGIEPFIINNNNSNKIRLYVRSIGRSLMTLEFPIDVKVSDVFSFLASKCNLDPDKIDVICFQHLTMNQFTFLSEFIHSAGRAGDLILTNRRDIYFSPRHDLQITIRGPITRDLNRYPILSDDEQ